MRELELWRAVSFLDAFEHERVGRAPRARSGLAHAAGFAGVLCLFQNSLGTIALSQWGVESGVWWSLFNWWDVFSPLAVALAFASAVSLDRSREKAGAMPALFGLVAGLVGTVNLLLTLGPQWWAYLKAF